MSSPSTEVSRAVSHYVGSGAWRGTRACAGDVPPGAVAGVTDASAVAGVTDAVAGVTDMVAVEAHDAWPLRSCTLQGGVRVCMCLCACVCTRVCIHI